MSVSTASAYFFNYAKAIFFCSIFSFKLLSGGVYCPLSALCPVFGSVPSKLLNSSFNCSLKSPSIDLPLVALKGIDLEVGKASAASSGIACLIAAFPFIVLLFVAL
jgi:hypothetical protein